jgi:hypothetical protein
MVKVFLGIHRAVFMNELPTGGRFNARRFCHDTLWQLSVELHAGRRYYTARPTSTWTMPVRTRRSRQKNVFIRATFDMHPALHHQHHPWEFFLFGDLKSQFLADECAKIEEA